MDNVLTSYPQGLHKIYTGLSEGVNKGVDNMWISLLLTEFSTVFPQGRSVLIL